MRRLRLYAASPSAAVEDEAPRDRDPSCSRCDLGAQSGIRTVCVAPELADTRLALPPRTGVQVAADAAERLGGGGLDVLARDEPAPLLFVVGDGTSRADDAEGRPFVGDSGRLVRAFIKDRWRGPVVFDNAVRCHGGRLPITDKHVDACRGYLASTIREAAPARVVAFGSWAAYSVVGRGVSSTSSRRAYAYLFGTGEEPVPVFFVAPPAPALRNRFVRRAWEEDLGWALTTAPPRPAPVLASVRVVADEADARAAVAECQGAEGDWAAFDVETAGVMWEPSFRLLSVALCKRGSVSPWVWDREALSAPAPRDVLVGWLEDPLASKLGQNVKYDVNAVRCALGAEVRGLVGDTRLWRRLIEPAAGASLDAMSELVGMGGTKDEAKLEMHALVGRVRYGLSAEKRLDAQAQQPAKKWPKLQAAAADGLAYLRDIDQRDPDLAEVIRSYPGEWGKWGYALVDHDLLGRYNGRDAVATARLGAAMEVELARVPELDAIRRKVVDGASRAIAHVERWGIGVDRGALRVFDSHLTQRLLATGKRIDGYGLEFNRDSPKQVAEVLFEKLGLDLPRGSRTKTGAASTSKEVLAHLASKHPLPKDLLEWRKLTKLKGTYAGSLPGEGMLAHVRSDGRIHPSILLDGAGTGRTSCRDPNCFDALTEVLTPRGWVHFDALSDLDLVAQWEAGRVSFVEPTARLRRAHDGEMVRIKNGHIDLLVTPDHRCLHRDRKTGALRVVAASEYPRDALQLHAGVLTDGLITLGADLVRLLVAVQADGSWHDGGVDFTLKKTRKVMRLLALLERLGLAFSHNPDQRGRHRIRAQACPTVERLRDVLGTEKVFGPWVLDLCRSELDAFVEELWHWDGCVTRMNHYASRDKRNADIVQAALALSGFRARERRYVNRQGSVSWQVDVTRRDYSHTANTIVERVPYRGDVYCVSVPSSYLLVRRGQDVMVTGNCQNIPRPTTPEGKMARDIFCAPHGSTLVQLDFSQIELRVAAMLSGDEDMIDIFRAGVDYHQRTAEMISQIAWGIDPSQVTKEHRSIAKVTNFACLYGAGDDQIAAQILAAGGGRLTKQQVGRIREAILGKFRRLAAWIEERVAETRKTGVMWTWWDGQRARRRQLWEVADYGDGDSRRSVAEHGAFNGPIQGSASDFCVASLAAAVEWIEADGLEADVKLVLPVHDSLLFEVRDALVPMVVGTVREIMTGWNSLGVPLVVDAEVGRSWGALKRLEVV